MAGAEPILLAAIEFNLFLSGLRSLKEDILATTDKTLAIYSVDYDLVDQKVFWADPNADSIRWMSMATKKDGIVLRGMPYGKALSKCTEHRLHNEGQLV